MSVQPSRTTLGPPALPRSWKPVLTRVVLLGSALFCLVFFSGMGALGPDDWQLHDRVGIAVAGLLFALVLAVLARPVARADRHGVTVVNFVRRRRLEWPQILGVNLRQGDPWVVLDLADGGTLAVVAIQPGSGRRQAVRAARELRACVDAYGTARR
ncbi:PH domain-containing protein [Streptacidiphilus sp. PB12-B1b]|uniref:PH domain-containing protein n=1 Tax=Streptacidiphilus sp. PB12-B1b TaxID=2705012 RepID=UPI0015F7D18F|nr:PH domain-containing protein [Streptacidiphilus sp. PB12-B1b]QMU76109.1 PH domain-containing protein [Streptacidiphilus sp. PB12-B1b]